MCKRKNTSKYLAIFILALSYFGYLSTLRLVSQDEGFYLIAAKLVAAGKTPYLDFFYPQAPLLPYFYGLFFKLFGSSLGLARFITAILISLLGLLIYRQSEKSSNTKTAPIIFLLFLFSNFVLANFLVAQTYALSSLLLFISYYCFLDKKFLISAIFLGLSVQTRLIFAIIFPIFVIYLLIAYRKKEIDCNTIIIFTIGFCLSLLPSLYLLIQNPSAFWFNNLGYHQLRNTLTSAQSLENKVTVAKVIFGLRDSVKFSAWQLPLLIYLNVLGAFYLLISQRKINLSFSIIITLLITHLIPSPTYVQYFVVLIPFLLISLAEITNIVNNQKLLLITLTFLTLFYLFNYTKDLARYTKTGEGVIGIMNQKNATHWSMENIQSIMNKTKNLCQPEMTAWSYWPGYLLTANCTIYPGTENHFAYLVSPKLNQQQLSNYQLVNIQEIAEQIKQSKFDLIISAEPDQRRHRLNFQDTYNQQEKYFYLAKK